MHNKLSDKNLIKSR